MTGTMPTFAASGAVHNETRFAFSNPDSSKSLAAYIAGLEPASTPAAVLSHYAGIGMRAAELALQNNSGLSARAIINALRSRIGDRVLEFILGNPAPMWRRAELRLMGVADLERQLEQLEQQRRHLSALLESRR